MQRAQQDRVQPQEPGRAGRTQQFDAIVAERPAEPARAHDPRRGEPINDREHEIERVEQRHARPASAVLREVRVESP
ncbi:hypothetical protein KPA93_15270, partial [Burkholderia cenocepacia]|uniref:hypothetical protein n=1 Tax=Burkholderia cenocepacia TaxID=95486 RepID=UPI0028628DA6